MKKKRFTCEICGGHKKKELTFNNKFDLMIIFDYLGQMWEMADQEKEAIYGKTINDLYVDFAELCSKPSWECEVCGFVAGGKQDLKSRI